MPSQDRPMVTLSSIFLHYTTNEEEWRVCLSDCWMNKNPSESLGLFILSKNGDTINPSQRNTEDLKCWTSRLATSSNFPPGSMVMLVRYPLNWVTFSPQTFMQLWVVGHLCRMVVLWCSKQRFSTPNPKPEILLPPRVLLWFNKYMWYNNSIETKI